MLFLITGASGSGKSACIPHLAPRVPGVALHDFDDVGVPPNADKAWRHRTTEHWVRRALEHQREGRDMALCGNVLLGEVLAAPSAPALSGVAACLLDVHDVERVDRVRRRGTPDLASQDMLSWAAWQRMHAVDPRWRPDVIQDGGEPGMRWERWSGWERGDPRWRTWVLDTTHLALDDVAERLAAWISSSEFQVPSAKVLSAELKQNIRRESGPGTTDSATGTG
jgi:hypothetical protein